MQPPLAQTAEKREKQDGNKEDNTPLLREQDTSPTPAKQALLLQQRASAGEALAAWSTPGVTMLGFSSVPSSSTWWSDSACGQDRCRLVSQETVFPAYSVCSTACMKGSQTEGVRSLPCSSRRPRARAQWQQH